MNESTRTLTFVGVAGVLAAAAFGIHAATRPVSLDEFSDVGDEFYEDFKNPRDATGLRVAAYNAEAARVDVFDVAFKDGLWRIPSHHDYPADGEERLANTATSIIGLEREALVSTSADDHKRLGVLDPLDETLTGTEGRGDRITLSKGDQTLADYIVGTKIEDGPPNTYNVRRADEDRTYRATLDLDISTKFADWIEPDLLDFRRGDIRGLAVDRYTIDETRGAIIPGDKSELARTTQDEPWQLSGIDEDKDKVKVSTVNQMISALEDLAIVGVRPKPVGLSADLKGGSIVAEDGSVSRTTFHDLQRHGFFLLQDGSLKSNEGEVTLAQSNGVKYVLGFGEVFTGSDVEIEVGSSPADGEPKPEEAAADDSSADEAAEGEADGDSGDKEGGEGEKDDSLKQSRYLFILAQLDESLIEPLPEKPVKPEPPAEKKADKKEEKTEESEPKPEKADDDAEAADTADDKEEAAETPNEETKAKEEPATEAKTDDGEKPDEEADENSVDKPDPQAEYKQALTDYEVKLKDWEARQQERAAKIEAGKERVGELNARFADWYYVISAEKFDDIRIAPEDLVEAVDPPKEDAEASPAVPEAKPAPAEKPAEPSDDKKPATEKPQTDAPKTETPEADKPAAEKPATDKPAAENSESSPDSPAEESSSDAPAEAKESSQE